MKETLEKRIDLLWKQHEYIADFIKLADTKAGFIAGVSTAILGAMYSTHNSITTSAQTGNHPFIQHLLVHTSVVFFIASTITAAWTIKPRLFTGRSKRPISWVDIANYRDPDEFDKEHSELSLPSLAKYLSANVHSMARICRLKHGMVAVALIFSLIGGAAIFTEFLLR